ncbi:TT1751-like protein [Stipitochalara longipes BDJ]|nr:TT1751-like protein [Stipitochalara longipes BDJ]
MTQPPSIKSQSFEGTRITVDSSKPFDEVISSLYSSIGSPADTSKWIAIAENIKSYSDEERKEFVSAVSKTIGPHGFKIFKEFDHGAWIPLFGVGGGLKLKRVILGNPLIAITMLKRDLTVGLFVPVEILVIEKEKNGGTEVVYTLPSCLIAGLNKDEELVEAVKVLDGKLEVLARDILA